MSIFTGSTAAKPKTWTRGEQRVLDLLWLGILAGVVMLVSMPHSVWGGMLDGLGILAYWPLAEVRRDILKGKIGMEKEKEK